MRFTIYKKATNYVLEPCWLYQANLIFIAIMTEKTMVRALAEE